MADNQSKYGFQWIGAMQGGQGSPPVALREVFASAYAPAPGGTAVNINVGDPVIRVNDGTVALAAAGNATYGIVAGFGPSDFTGASVGSAWQKYYATGAAGTPGSEQEQVVFVYPVAGQIFRVEVDDNTSITTLANYRAAMGENADITINADSTSKQARPRIDISTHAVTNTLVWRLYDYDRNVNADPSGLYFKVYVTCNLVQQAPYTILGV